MVLLESVGTYLDTNNGMTYPANSDNTPDMTAPYHLNDIEQDEWMLSLSEEDFDVVANYLSGLLKCTKKCSCQMNIYQMFSIQRNT